MSGSCATYQRGMALRDCDECGQPRAAHTHEHAVNESAGPFADDLLARVPIEPPAGGATEGSREP